MKTPVEIPKPGGLCRWPKREDGLTHLLTGLAVGDFVEGPIHWQKYAFAATRQLQQRLEPITIRVATRKTEDPEKVRIYRIE